MSDFFYGNLNHILDLREQCIKIYQPKNTTCFPKNLLILRPQQKFITTLKN